LLLLVLLAAAPVFAIQTYRELERRRAFDAGVAEQAGHLADLAAAQQDRMVEGVRYMLTAIAALPEVTGHDGAGCSARMAAFHRQLPDIAWLGVVDAKGDLFCTSAPSDRPLNLSNRDYVEIALSQHRFAVSRYLEGRITGQRQLAFGLPLADGGAALAAVNLDALPTALAETQLPPNAALSFHDREGLLLARTPERRDLLGRPLPPSLTQAVAEGRRSATALGLDGTPRVFSVAALRTTPDLFVAVGLPFAEAEAAANREFRRDMALSAAAFALLALAAFAGGQFWLRRPLAGVQRAFDRVAAGRLDARAERQRGQPPELAELAAGFDAMARALQARDERLKDSERRLADIAANLPGVVYRRVLSPDGMLRYDYMSEGVRKLLGAEPEQFMEPLPVEEHARRMARADRAAWLGLLTRSAQSLEPFELTFRAQARDGSRRWLRSTARPRREPDGSVVWDGVTLDISDRVAAEEALKESEARFRDVAEAAAEIIWETDADGRFSYFSDQLERVSGVDPAKLLGKRRLDLVDEAVPPSTLEGHLADLAARRPFRNFTYLANDLVNRRCFSSSGRPIFDEAGAFRGYRGAGSDVTERMAEEAQRARLAAIVEASHDAIVSWDLSGRITSWNAEAERFFGYAAEEAVGRSIRMLVPPERQAGVEPVMSAVANGEWFHGVETVRIRKDGGRIDAALTISPVRGAEGRVVAGATIARDITERKRAEDRQRLLLAELDHRVKNMLAVLLAVFQTTAQNARSLEEFRRTFEGRLMALVRAHDALAQNKMDGVGLRELVVSELALFCDSSSERLQLDGEQVLLGPKAAQAIGMALHELATNAAKHGALSVPGGRIAVGWRVRANGEKRLLHMWWRERGGPPVAKPDAAGFGLSLLERGLAYELGGVARVSFEAEGVAWEMTAPLGPAEEPLGSDDGAQPGQTSISSGVPSRTTSTESGRPSRQ
jgi:PAS domain S-box-containing protein